VIQASAPDIASSLNFLAFLVGFVGFIVLLTSLQAMRRHRYDSSTVWIVMACAVFGAGLMGFAIYILSQRAHLPVR
jgi:preprotein translocase subunit Sss1